MAVSSAVAVALGTWGCRYRELRPISFGGAGGSNRSPAPTTTSTAASSTAPGQPPQAGPSNDSVGDEEQGFVRGGRRGRGRDGAGEYEMVSLKPGDGKLQA